MLHWWLIPGLLILVAVLGVFYLAVRFTGGSGVRTEGRTVHDEAQDDDNPPPA
jgi:hypothetical protein